MKLVQKPLTPWISVFSSIALLLTTLSAGAQQPEYLQHFDPAKGFKPAKANLTKIFLQIAGSLECHGTPEPYLRHMQQEHARIDRIYEQKAGKPHVSRMPVHMTAAYVDRVVKNWNTLSKPLELEALAKEIGSFMREGIMGTRLSGTLAVQILNEHQQQVAGGMGGGDSPAADFTELKKRLQQELEFGKDKIDTSGYDTSRRDAVSYASFIDGAFRKQFQKIESIAKPEKAELIKQGIAGVFLDLGHLAQSELEAGILEQALVRPGS